MKKIIKSIIRIFVLLLIVYIFFSLYLQFFAKGHIQRALSRSLGEEVRFSRIVYRIPLEFQLYDVRIGERLSADGVSVRFSKDVFMDKSIPIARIYIVRPRLVLPALEPLVSAQDPDSAVPAEQAIGKASAAEGGSSGAGLNHTDQISGSQPDLDQEGVGLVEGPEPEYRIRVQRLVVKDGYVEYPYTFSGNQIILQLNRISLHAQKISYPLQAERTEFQFKGDLSRLSDTFPQTSLAASGWVDILHRDMDAQIALKALDQGELLKASIVSRHNDVQVEGELHSRHLFKKSDSDGKSSTTVEDMAMKALSLFGVDVGVRFRFETKLDDFRISNVSFSGRVGNPASSGSADEK